VLPPHAGEVEVNKPIIVGRAKPSTAKISSSARDGTQRRRHGRVAGPHVHRGARRDDQERAVRRAQRRPTPGRWHPPDGRRQGGQRPRRARRT
jgi:hypothetical protein